MFRPSTHIDENRELTIGVSERQIRGLRFSWGLFSGRYSDELRNYQKKY